MARKAWSPAEDELLTRVWNTPGMFANVIQPHFPDRTERSIQMQAIYLQLGPRPSRSSAAKCEIQKLLSANGPMATNRLCEHINATYESVRYWINEMSKAGQIVKVGEIPSHGVGRNSVLWGIGEVPVEVAPNRSPKNKKRQSCSDVFQRIIDAAKAPRLPIKHHELTLALFGMGEPA
ncbi:MAG: hypothetical protein KGL35_21530 [Bradyrhizobium sp.]|nr:hypothetical protein [Bradyrhizobium sp.]